MSDEKTYTLEEVRDAFYRGSAWVRCMTWDKGGERISDVDVDREALRRYPLPQKLREVEFRDLSYRVRDGVVEVETVFGHWTKIDDAAYYTTIAALIAHPYEDDK